MNSPFDLEGAKILPPLIRFGTSTWTYPGWKGLIYKRPYRSEKMFNAESLREYASIPLFRTVGIDSTFYGPPKASTLHSYSSMVPEHFKWVSKVWERITVPVFPTHPRYGSRAGKVNEDFLNSAIFIEEVLPPYLAPEVLPHTGPFVFQFPHISPFVMKEGRFLSRLRTFLSCLPQTLRYALEIRNPELLSPEYFSVLNDTGATHCFNHWTGMPPLREQMVAAANAGGLSAPFFVSRILTPLGIPYEKAVELFSPYNEIRRENSSMRADVVRLIKRALDRQAEAFIIVNNRSEGCSPLTIDAIGRMVRNELLRPQAT